MSRDIQKLLYQETINNINYLKDFMDIYGLLEFHIYDYIPREDEIINATRKLKIVSVRYKIQITQRSVNIGKDRNSYMEKIYRTDFRNFADKLPPKE